MDRDVFEDIDKRSAQEKRKNQFNLKLLRYFYEIMSKKYAMDRYVFRDFERLSKDEQKERLSRAKVELKRFYNIIQDDFEGKSNSDKELVDMMSGMGLTQVSGSVFLTEVLNSIP
ncbi:uncharacterized protein LOC108141767 [Drosophila elegans]|uniref:uncharacterized protein LOC108141767 n=1 Tax=Drosophila elegans TaxID=30023 RepID=UPI0007E665E2|nr:uncharacterized protein LOC108141767 [Drosophila elegans]